MVEVILDRLNRKWVFVILLFGLGLITPYFLTGFFQSLSAQDELSASVTYPETLKKEFEQAVRLSESGKHLDAIKAYQKIIDQYPNYPEPYNNLAVLYAKTNQLNLAQETLEKAMKTNPAYAAIYDNLADVYRSMAAEAYRKALHIDKPTEESPTKLTMIASLSSQPSAQPATRRITGEPIATVASNSVNSLTQPAQEKPVVTDPASRQAVNNQPKPAEPVANTAASEKPVQIARADTKPADTKPTEVKPAEVKPFDTKPSDTAGRSQTDAQDKAPLVAALKGWASAWSRQDMNAYLAAYDKNFKTPNGASRSQWENDRRVRIVGKDSISVSIEILSVSFASDDKATVRIRQRYSGGSLKTSTRKTMTMQRRGSGWKILEERIGG